MDRARHTTAAKQYLGFSLQVNRFLWHLLRAEPGDAVSLEVLGDVAVTSQSETVKVEEVKSRTELASNPITDRSVELWKTFRNWIDAIASGTLDPEKTNFVLYTSRQFEGRFLHRLIEASARDNPIEAIDSIRDELWGPPPNFPEKGKIARKLSAHLEEVFSPTGRESMRLILPRFSYQYGTESVKEELLASIRTKAIGDEVSEDVLLHLLGWVKDQTDRLIEAGEPAYVHEAAFHLELVAYARKVDRLHILASFAPPPTSESIDEHLATRLYITQLSLIEAPDEDKLAAISDYLRAETDRIDWAAKGLVHPSTFDDLEEELIRAWRSYQTRVNVGHKEKPDLDRGKLLFAECSLHKIPVQGNDAPAHFARGSFHALTDNLSIGWHPNYRSLLQSQGES